ncbi:MAG TPA: Holliday junction resolvase RuvX [Kofleriaceae bacterium]|nr:Holliday junction resolvase RuvX [Kofleriaceae bacterium]
MTTTRALGLDVGAKTIGVALSDALGIAAHPVTTIARRGIAADATAIVALGREHAVTDIVFGLPLELSGRAGHRAQRVRKLRDQVAAIAGDLAIHEWDERFSTTAAERVLIAADLSRRRRKQVIDKQAAAYILQGWLDARGPA